MAVFASDTFTGIEQTLGAHDARWVPHPSVSYDRILWVSDANRCRPEANADGAAAHYWSTVPATVEYDVECDVVFLSNERTFIGPAGRIDLAANTMYIVRWSVGSSRWELAKFVAGTFTLLGSWTETFNSGTRAIRLEIRDAAKKLFVDGVERVSSPDNAITATGYAGIRSAIGSTTGGGNTTGQHVDNFVATDLSASVPQLTGTGTGVGSGSATLQTIPQLTGTGTGIGSGSAAFGTVAVQLSGTATGTSSGSATLQTIPQLAGTGSGSGSGSSTLQTLTILSASGTGVGSGSAILRAIASLSGTATGIGSGSALLLPVPQLTGTGEGSGGGSALLQSLAILTSTGSGVGSGSALIQPIPQVSGTGTGVSSGSATFNAVAVQMSGTGTGIGSGSALLQVIPQLTGTATGLGSGSALLVSDMTAVQMSGTATGLGSGSALLQTIPQLAGTGTGLGIGSVIFGVGPQVTAIYILETALAIYVDFDRPVTSSDPLDGWSATANGAPIPLVAGTLINSGRTLGLAVGSPILPNQTVLLSYLPS